MGFELSEELGARVARYAEKAGVEPDEALTRLVEAGLRHEESPAMRPIGLFSSSGDVALMNEAVGRAYKERKRRRAGGSSV